MKHVVRVLPVLLILSFALTACGPAAAPATPQAPAATAAPAPTQAPAAATEAPVPTQAPAAEAPAGAIALPTPSKPIPPGTMITWAFGQPKFLQM